MDVALLKCDQYELELVKEKIRNAINLLGGWNISPNDRVFIKLNCVGPFSSEMGITTHPTFVQAVIQLVKEQTSHILIGDNPATKDILYTLRKNGLLDVIREENIPVFNGKESTTITTPHGKYYNSFEVSKQMIDVDVLINLPKLKTHAFAYMSVAEKNLFGFIYGLSKAAWHVRASNPLQFGEAINDLYQAIQLSYKDKQMIHLCDGILGLEGEGPSSGGKPIASKIILASRDAVSLDRVAAEVMGLDYRKQFINVIAHQRKLGQGDLTKISVLGNKIEDFSNLSFLPPRESMSILSLRLLKIKSIRNLILEYPVIDLDQCIQCGECAHICPPHAMTIEKGNYPHLARNLCIRCWCCAEVCPKNAISKSNRPIIGRLFLKDRN
ncbi:MAG: DUF362 domain-containing protein [Bacilli bacterium]